MALAIKAIPPEDYWNIDEIGIIKGLGVNSLYVGLLETKVVLLKYPNLRI